MGDSTVVILSGLAGGVAAETLKWYRIREELHKGIPDYAKKWLYWLVTLIMICLGGGLAYAYEQSDNVELSVLLAANIGASAPMIVSAVVGQIPQFDRGTVD